MKILALLSVLALAACGCNDTQEGCWFVGHPFRSESTPDKDIRFEHDGSTCTLRGRLETPAGGLKLGKSMESETSLIPGAVDVDPKDPGRA
jgi:hypothetical protein